MTDPAACRATYEDIIALPENRVGEIFHGRLYTHQRPAPKHAQAYSALGGKLGNAYGWGRDGPGGWWILDEPELHLGGDIIVPAIAGWRRKRLPALPDTAWFELAPDFACEILSPSTARTDRALKMPIYAREGVAHLWLVDSDAHTLEIYRLQDNQRWLRSPPSKKTTPSNNPRSTPSPSDSIHCGPKPPPTETSSHHTHRKRVSPTTKGRRSRKGNCLPHPATGEFQIAIEIGNKIDGYFRTRRNG